MCLDWASLNEFYKKKEGIITANPLEVWPVCALPTRGSKLITLPTCISIRYPLLLCLSPLKTKNNRENSNKQDQRGGFVTWVQEHTCSWYEQS